MAIKVGDKVRLKSGAHAMTVDMLCDDGTAWCKWIDAQGKPQDEYYNVASLELVPADTTSGWIARKSDRVPPF